MDEKRPNKGFCAVRHPAKGKSAKDGGECFNIRLADMRQRKWDSLQPQSIVPKSTHIRKQDPAAKKEFPADQVNEGSPWQTGQKLLVISFHGCVAASQKINDGSHEKNAKRGVGQSQFPIAKRKTVLFRIFAK